MRGFRQIRHVEVENKSGKSCKIVTSLTGCVSLRSDGVLVEAKQFLVKIVEINTVAATLLCKKTSVRPCAML